MIGIDALDGFLPRRCKERHVMIREMVACLDSAQDESLVAHPASSARPAEIEPVAVTVAGAR